MDKEKNVLGMKVVYCHIVFDTDEMGFDGLPRSKTILCTNNSCILELGN